MRSKERTSKTNNRNNRNNRNTGSIRKLFFPLLAGLLAAFLLINALSMYFSQEREIEEMEKERKELLKQKSKVEEIRNELLDMSENWDSDDYIEKIAREEFGLVKPGEIILVE